MTTPVARPVERPTPRRTRLLAPWALALLAVAGQVVYPHTAGVQRDRLTITTVVLLAAASLLHAGLTRGWSRGAAVGIVLGGGGLAAELLGVATGFPFGDYAYSDRLGPALGEVPLLIPLAWAMLGWPAAVVTWRILSSRPRSGSLGFVAVGAVALTAWDLFLDPQMVAEGYWTWEAVGPAVLSGIPTVNYLGWLATSAVMMALLHPVLAADAGRGQVDDRLPIALYVWTWLGSVVAHLFYLDLPVSGVVGGLGMGVVVLALLRALARR